MWNMRAALASQLLFALIVGAPAQAATGKPGKLSPVAVMPFNNLNQDPKLDWMTLGIAETLISDIRKRSAMAVVEREQIDRALAELALQERLPADPSTVATVGRIVGAQTVVVGGFQQAGGQLRITARFVEVETGLVLDTAKATGPTTQIFSLQDEIVTRLLGHSRANRPARSKPARKRAAPATGAMLQAYELFANSFKHTDEASRTKLLQKALSLDPTFVYASDELNALQRRLRNYEADARKAQSKKEQALRETLANPPADAPSYMIQGAAVELYALLAQTGRYRATIALGRELLAMKWDGPTGESLPPMAMSWIFNAHVALKEIDLALQVGEELLKRFPASLLHGSIVGQMERLIKKRREQQQARSKVEKLLADKAFDLARLDLDRCRAAQREEQFVQTKRLCNEFLKIHAGSNDQRVTGLVPEVRWLIAEAHYEVGEFLDARVLADALIRDQPEFARNWHLFKRMRRWPRD